MEHLSICRPGRIFKFSSEADLSIGLGLVDWSACLPCSSCSLPCPPCFNFSDSGLHPCVPTGCVMLEAHWCFESWPGSQSWAYLVHSSILALVSACFGGIPTVYFHYFCFPPVSAGPPCIFGNTHRLQHVCLSFHVTIFWRQWCILRNSNATGRLIIVIWLWASYKDKKWHK